MSKKKPLRFRSFMSPFWLTTFFGCGVSYSIRRAWSSFSKLSGYIIFPNFFHHNIHAKINVQKRRIFVQNSIINCVYPKHHKYETCTSLHAVFNADFSGNVYFVIVIFNLHGRKMRLPESSQNSITEKSIFGLSEVNFLNIRFFSRAGVIFSC